MQLKLVIILLLHVFFASSTKKGYQKTYYDNGIIKSEGWISNDSKVDYWKFYYQTGNIKKEGRFLNDKEVKYWYFYSETGPGNG